MTGEMMVNRFSDFPWYRCSDWHDYGIEVENGVVHLDERLAGGYDAAVAAGPEDAKGEVGIACRWKWEAIDPGRTEEGYSSWKLLACEEIVRALVGSVSSRKGRICYTTMGGMICKR